MAADASRLSFGDIFGSCWRLVLAAKLSSVSAKSAEITASRLTWRPRGKMEDGANL